MTYAQTNAKIANTLSRALRGLAPKYRGRVHKNAHWHALSVAQGEYSPCAEYYSPVSSAPEGAVTCPYGYGVLAYICPYNPTLDTL